MSLNSSAEAVTKTNGWFWWEAIPNVNKKPLTWIIDGRAQGGNWEEIGRINGRRSFNPPFEGRIIGCFQYEARIERFEGVDEIRIRIWGSYIDTPDKVVDLRGLTPAEAQKLAYAECRKRNTEGLMNIDLLAALTSAPADELVFENCEVFDMSLLSAKALYEDEKYRSFTGGRNIHKWEREGLTLTYYRGTKSGAGGLYPARSSQALKPWLSATLQPNGTWVVTEPSS